VSPAQPLPIMTTLYIRDSLIIGFPAATDRYSEPVL
jgi:hypothetical protein